MTTQEAIEILQAMRDSVDWGNITDGSEGEAFDMAIEALSCSEKPNDLISRANALKEKYTVCIAGQVLEVVQVETLMGLPSVPPLSETDLLELEHRFGEWARFVVEDMLTGKGERWEKEKI